MVREFVKYNPAFLESEKLVDNFVVRQTDLQMIVRIVHDNTADSNQHVLVIGPRGSGKTTLVRRVSVEIGRDDALSTAWYPLIFAEESYNALSTADFWLESLFHLAEQTGESRWMESYHELRRDPDEKRLAQRALSQLLDFADSIGKRILLVVENLDMLLSEFSDEADAWALRHTLMNEPRLMLLATATGRFEGIDHPSKAMFEMFRIHDLKPLNDDECNMIWALFAGAPLPGMQIRPIRILTGGNARLIGLIARFGAQRSFRELLEDLIDLIDEHTDYFKGHLDNMAPMERKVYLALAELWKQSSAKEIAEVARLDVNTTSAYLKRLAGRGKVAVEDEGKRKKWYSISEGIYNIYYLMRRRGGPSARVKAAVRFMVCLYEPVAAAKLVIDESSALDPEACRDYMMAFSEIYRSAPDFLRFEIARIAPSAVIDSPYLDRAVKDEIMAYNSSEKKGDDEIKKILEILNKGVKSGEMNRLDDEMNLYKELIEKYGDRQESEIVKLVASAMFNIGVALCELNQLDEAIALYKELIEKYGDYQESEIVEIVASAMYNIAIKLGELNQLDEAMDLYKELIERYGDRQEAQIIELVAIAMLSNGERLRMLNQFDEALKFYDNMIEMFGHRQEIQIAEQVANALYIKGLELTLMGNIDESVAIVEELNAKYGNRHETQIIVRVAGAMCMIGLELALIHRFDESIAWYDKLIANYGDCQEAQIVELVARVMYLKGIVLSELGQIEEALKSCEELIAKYANYQEVQIAESLAKAMHIKAVLLDKLGKRENAIIACDELMEKYDDRLEAQIAEPVAKAMLYKGGIFIEMKRSVETVAVYEQLIAKYSQYQEDSLVKILLTARLMKAFFLLKNEKQDDALTEFKAVLNGKTLPENEINLFIQLIIEFTVSGEAKTVLHMLSESPAAQQFELLIAVLQLYCGQDVRTAPEILEVVKDVVKRIKDLKHKIESEKA